MNGFLDGLGLTTKARRMATLGALLALIVAGLMSPARPPNPQHVARASQEAAREIVEQSAIAQCAEAIAFTNRRAKLGFSNVKHTAAGDVLVEQPFSVPVFGYNERDEYRARCALRKNGSFEFGVVR